MFPGGNVKITLICETNLTKNENTRDYKIDRSRQLYLVATKGSHRQYKHSVKPGRVTIAGRLGHDLAPGTLNSVLKQAQLKEKKEVR